MIMSSNAQTRSEDKEKIPAATVHVHSDKPTANSINGRNLDTAAKLVAGVDGALDPVEAQRIRCVHLNFSTAVPFLTNLHTT